MSVIDLTPYRFRINRSKQLLNKNRYSVKEIEYSFVEDTESPNSLFFIKDTPQDIISALKEGDIIKVRGEFAGTDFQIPHRNEKVIYICEAETEIRYVKRQTYVDPHWVIDGFIFGVSFCFNIKPKKTNYLVKTLKNLFNTKLL